MPDLLQARVEACYQAAENYFQRAFKRPTISFQLRGKKAGVAHICENRLRFNPQLYQENLEHFLLHTVAHEVAHMVAYQVYGKHIRAHGHEWQAIMAKVYQLPAQRCHNYPVQHSKRTHYLYHCSCPEREPFALSGQRHARIKKGMHYLCRQCQTPLIYSKQQVQC
ncbi:SprT family zinc-dependent metalloprotease [Denitrificimonas sp. JX-1]|uniref:SprT family zinc-dependent metalloprotease n=1 Tax=Denitrificimonas halotolerans TaxID=3098930 RepID=A0ABU5GQ67_9GAMM|nr:SprT family zinc-dependent metalloprotease [Denitrificimonas sp. JX-1]MDY7219142.1 SprT family zinc-dependent metalloprotease [Denitrificimonas sp. JX-1]